MSTLEGRVAVITGAGRGLGREHALLLASHGVRVVVNDLGGTTDGAGQDVSVAQQVVDEIRAAGGEAVVNTDSVTSWDGSKRLIESAVEAFGGLDILVNNAGILRDKMLVNMAEEEFEAVLTVHSKGTFCPTRHAAAYWRDCAKAGEPRRANVINTSSGAGLFHNIGQANYGAAKAAIAAFSQIAAKELERYGVRVNTIAPMARTRLTLQTPGFGEVVASGVGKEFDIWDPANVSPLVAYLASADCPFTGGVFHVFGGRIDLVDGWSFAGTIEQSKRWTVEDLATAMPRLLESKPGGGVMVSEAVDLDEMAKTWV